MITLNPPHISRRDPPVGKRFTVCSRRVLKGWISYSGLVYETITHSGYEWGASGREQVAYCTTESYKSWTLHFLDGQAKVVVTNSPKEAAQILTSLASQHLPKA